MSDYFDFVQAASNGEEALEKYKKYSDNNGKTFDIVMTDYEMPKLTGIELIKAIKKQHNNQVFVVISAHQNPENLIEFINLGILHFTPKPIAPESILEVLHKASDMCYDNEELVWNKNKKALFYKHELIYFAKYDLLLIEILLENFNFVCSNDDILNHFYLNNIDIKKENIRNLVVRLRKKIPLVKIISFYGNGYKLTVADVKTEI